MEADSMDIDGGGGGGGGSVRKASTPGPAAPSGAAAAAATASTANGDAGAGVGAGSDGNTGAVAAANVDAPNFDLEAYAARYTGYTKVQRLLFIAQRCKARELDAYRLALDALKAGGLNVEMYKKVAGLVNGRLGEAYAPDRAWAEAVEKRAAATKERLESDLQAARTSMSKESIRLGYNDLGAFFYQRGDLDNALKNFVRTRDYCNITRHNIEMCLNVIKVSVAMGSFTHVNNYVSKAEHTPDLTDPRAVAKLRAAAGLAQLNQRNYAAAARKFLDCSAEHLAAKPASASSSSSSSGAGAASSAGAASAGAGAAAAEPSAFSEVLAPEDVAVYGGLCALASFDRQELKRRVVDNVGFKAFLDLVPAMRELLLDFTASRYGSCLQYLGELQPELLLDVHLHPHVPALYRRVRERCLLQFFAPYLSVDLRRMAGAFHVPVEELEAEVADLIMGGRLPARVDSQGKTLHRRQVHPRDEGYRKVLAMGQDFLREIRAMLLRTSLLEHGLAVEGPGRGGGGGGGRGGGGGGEREVGGALGGLGGAMGMMHPSAAAGHHLDDGMGEGPGAGGRVTRGARAGRRAAAAAEDEDEDDDLEEEGEDVDDDDMAVGIGGGGNDGGNQQDPDSMMG